MRLTTSTDYALRVLLRLGLRQFLTTIAAMVEDYRISENHLMKVIHQLGIAGLYRNRGGNNGG